MERNWKKLLLSNGSPVYIEENEVVMLAEDGGATLAVLSNGAQFRLAGPVATVAEALSEFRLRGVDHLRLNPNHVLAIEARGINSCRLHLSAGLTVDADDISASDMSFAIERQSRYPWETIRMKPSDPAAD